MRSFRIRFRFGYLIFTLYFQDVFSFEGKAKVLSSCKGLSLGPLLEGKSEGTCLGLEKNYDYDGWIYDHRFGSLSFILLGEGI